MSSGDSFTLDDWAVAFAEAIDERRTQGFPDEVSAEEALAVLEALAA